MIGYKARPTAKDFIQVEIVVEKNTQKIIIIGKVSWPFSYGMDHEMASCSSACMTWYINEISRSYCLTDLNLDDCFRLYWISEMQSKD